MPHQGGKAVSSHPIQPLAEKEGTVVELQYVKSLRLKSQSEESYAGIEEILPAEDVEAIPDPDQINDELSRAAFDEAILASMDERLARKIKRFLLSRPKEDVIRKIYVGARLDKTIFEPGERSLVLQNAAEGNRLDERIWNRFLTSRGFRARAIAALGVVFQLDLPPTKTGHLPPVDFSFVERWANSHKRAQDADVSMVARAIAAQTSHIIEFDDDCLALALDCDEPLGWIPYPVTLVHIPNRQEAWGIAAIRSGGGISIMTIGAGDLSLEGSRLLAFLENRCRPEKGGGPANFVSDGSLRPRRAMPPDLSGEDEGGRNRSRSLPFTRRPHYRRQHYGPGNQYVKVILIGKTTVDPSSTETEASLPMSRRTHRVSLRSHL